MDTIEPCPSTAWAVLAVVGDPVELRCGKLADHEGLHEFHLLWSDPVEGQAA